MNRIIKVYEMYDCTHISDFLSILMANVEDSFLQSGLQPSKDYNANTIITTTMSLFSSIISKEDIQKKEITYSWPKIKGI